VVEVLGDAAARLILPQEPVPRSLAAYLVTTIRHRAHNARRDHDRRARLERDALGETALDGPSDGAVGSTCSEGSLRASRGPAIEASPLAAPLRRLAATLDASLSDEERLVLVWVSHQVPQRQIAGWLGLSYAATSKRIERLRARLRDVATRHAAAVDAGEREALLRFFRRAAGVPEAGTRTGAGDGAATGGAAPPERGESTDA
jgi:DNA-directed RNA polymerase specialized sigma24 family protein